jgi:hypothetical protein
LTSVFRGAGICNAECTSSLKDELGYRTAIHPKHSLRLKEINTSEAQFHSSNIPRNSIYFLELTGNIFLRFGTTGFGKTMDADAETSFSIRIATENKADPKVT